MINLHPPFFLPQAKTITGWFAVGFSSEFKVGCIKKIKLFGCFLLLMRSKSGKLNIYPEKYFTEQNNIIFIWQDITGEAPHWNIPIQTEHSWSKYLTYFLVAKTHPQEVFENCIDINHFGKVHHFNNVNLQSVVYADHCLKVKYFICRNKALLWKKLKRIKFELSLYGLGCAITHIDEPTFNLKIRMLTLATPREEGKLEIRIAVSVLRNKNYLHNMFNLLIHRLIQKNIVADFLQDIPIWESKIYRPFPLLVNGEQEILKFRRWCKQFYTVKH